ncbi:MAG: DUF2520 domain-containing protein [Thermonemataceae bacterium]|nr:DUF2520 domain-containing protein [Thermonemataceae bacterium]
MQIAIIGSGNVAWHLALALEKNGISIRYLYGRNAEQVGKLAEILPHTKVSKNTDFSQEDLDFILIAVSDNAIDDVVAQIKRKPQTIMLHTSGSVSIDVFAGNNYGVFYPLQTFSKKRAIDFSVLPVCVEADSENTLLRIKNLATKMTKVVYEVNSQDRRILHLSAVFASNFTNHLLALSRDLLQPIELPFSILQPLLLETIEKAFAAEHPKQVQTGPAIRRDTQTIEKHLQILENKEFIQKIYQLLSESIQRS